MRLQDVEDLSTDARRAFWRQGAGILRADLWSANMPCAGVVCLHAERASASELRRILRGLEEAEFRAVQSRRASCAVASSSLGSAGMHDGLCHCGKNLIFPSCLQRFCFSAASSKQKHYRGGGIHNIREQQTAFSKNVIRIISLVLNQTCNEHRL